MRHEKAYNKIARERCNCVMYFYLNHDVQLQEAGLAIQSHLLCIVETPMV